jgi:SurA-like N-terminal domain
MIGTIRKHSGVLWAVIITATIISFIWFFNPSQRFNNGGGGPGNLGSIYGKQVTPTAYQSMRNEAYIFHLFNYGNWPDKDPNFSKEDLARQIYVRLMLVQKAGDLGIYVGDDAVATAAGRILQSPDLIRALKYQGESVPLDEFVKQILQPEGLSAADFENFVRHDLIIEQMQKAMGLTGALVTPQEAAMVYQRLHREVSAQIVLFSASNYLSQVTVTPAAVAQFYTNYLAEYRVPDRIQVSYVEFNITNFLAQAKAELAKTNLDEQVDGIYDQYGLQIVPDAKTPEAAKAKIREILIRRSALAAASAEADKFANAVFSMDPAKPENLAIVARQKGLVVHVTQPFDSQYGPAEFTAPDGFIKTAFGLSPDEPFSSPIVGPDGVYVIAFNKKLPSEIPSLEQIHDRVTEDFKMHAATLLAQAAGTNAAVALKIKMATGGGFTSACQAVDLKPEALPPFSLSTKDVPELAGRIELSQLKQAAFVTPVGQASGFEETDNGGFIVYVQSQLPVDKTQMDSDLPQFTAALRQRREAEAFNEWVMHEAGRELGNLPAFRPQAETGAASGQ